MRGVSHCTCVLAHSHGLMIVTSVTGSSRESGLAQCLVGFRLRLFQLCKGREAVESGLVPQQSARTATVMHHALPIA